MEIEGRGYVRRRACCPFYAFRELTVGIIADVRRLHSPMPLTEVGEELRAV